MNQILHADSSYIHMLKAEYFAGSTNSIRTKVVLILGFFYVFALRGNLVG